MTNNLHARGARGAGLEVQKKRFSILQDAETIRPDGGDGSGALVAIGVGRMAVRVTREEYQWQCPQVKLNSSRRIDALNRQVGQHLSSAVVMPC